MRIELETKEEGRELGGEIQQGMYMESEVLIIDASKYAEFMGITYLHGIKASLHERKVARAAQK